MSIQLKETINAARKQKQELNKENNSQVLSTLIRQARKSGQLNLSNRSLDSVPTGVWRINIDTPEEGRSLSLDAVEDRWWEQVDLIKLILASNNLSVISEDIVLLPALTVLDLHDNKLTELPNSLKELTCITRLNLSQNNFTHFPSVIIFLTNLQNFQIQYNSITTIPDDFDKLNNLEELDISNNKIVNLPASIGAIKGLLKLNISNNMMQNLPHQIGNLLALTSLDANNNKIHTLPDELGFLRNLELLYLKQNKLRHLPLLEHCSKLKELHLGDNLFQGISSDQFPFLQSLAILDLRDNQFKILEEEMANLSNLERIDLTNNALSTLPYSLGTMQKLKYIVLDGNPMKGIRRDIVMRGTSELKKFLASRIEKDLPTEVSSTNVKSNPITNQNTNNTSENIDIFTIKSTRTLDLCGKKLDKISNEYFDAVINCSIEQINFSKNNISRFPDRLFELKQTIIELNIGFNKLVSIPDDIGKLNKLTYLNICNNQITSLPESLQNLIKLREIDVSNNCFKSIPDCIYKLSSLEILLIHDNKIESIDADLFLAMSKLAVLDLQNNNISTVPPKLGHCTQLRSLKLEGNQFRHPRIAILAKGTIFLLQYLRERIAT